MTDRIDSLDGASHKVTMFVFNAFRPDVRVLKEAQTLSNFGLNVKVLALLDNENREIETYGEVAVVRLPKLGLKSGSSQKKSSAKTNTCSKRCLSEESSKTKKICSPEVQSAEVISEINHVLQRLIDETFIVIRKTLFILVKYIIYKPLKFLRKKIARPIMYFNFYRNSYIHCKKHSSYIYHAHDLNTLPVACWCKKKLGGVVVYDSHELFTETSLLPAIERKIWRIVEKKLIKQCDSAITVCDSIAIELQQRYSLVERPTVLRNCPDKKTFGGVRTNRIRDKVGVPDNEPIVLYQGGFSENRGLPELIRAFGKIDRGVLVLMGWGLIEYDLREQISKEGLDNKVVIIPPAHQADLLNWTCSADLGIIPYQAVGLNNYYSCPNKLFEYINAGLPVAASNFPELSRIITDWDIGATFDPSTPESMSKTINNLLADTARLSQCRKNAQKASMVLNWDVESEKLIQIYTPYIQRISG